MYVIEPNAEACFKEFGEEPLVNKNEEQESEYDEDDEPSITIDELNEIVRLVKGIESDLERIREIIGITRW